MSRRWVAYCHFRSYSLQNWDTATKTRKSQVQQSSSTMSDEALKDYRFKSLLITKFPPLPLGSMRRGCLRVIGPHGRDTSRLSWRGEKCKIIYSDPAVKDGQPYMSSRRTRKRFEALSRAGCYKPAPRGFLCTSDLESHVSDACTRECTVNSVHVLNPLGCIKCDRNAKTDQVCRYIFEKERVAHDTHG